MYFIQICVVSSVLTTAGTSVRFLLKPWLQLSNDLSVLSWGKLGRNCYSPKPLRGLLLTQGSAFSMERSRALSWAPKVTSGCCRAPGGLCPPSHDRAVQWGTNQTCQHRNLHAPPVLPLKCYQGEPGSCTALSTGDVQPPRSSGFQGLKITQFLDLMQVNNSLSASPSSLRWIDFVPELAGCFLTLRASETGSEWDAGHAWSPTFSQHCSWTFRKWHNTPFISLWSWNLAQTYCQTPDSTQFYDHFTFIAHLPKKSRFGTKLKIRCAGCNTPLTRGDIGLEQRSV